MSNCIELAIDMIKSDEFGVKVGVHQGSVLSPLLFVIVLKALSCEFRTGTPWELLYADDLVISAETEEGLKMKLNKWKTEMEAKGLRVNMGKTKIMVSGVNLQTLKDSGEYPCSVCRKGVGSNSIYCAGCSHWVHKKCSGVTGSLKRTLITVVADAKVLLVQLTGDLIMNGFLCKIKNWMLLIHSATVLLYASECWAPNVNDLLKLQRNDRAMIRWTCTVRLKDHISSDSLLRKLGINNIQTLL